MKKYCHKIRYIFILLIVFVSCNSSKEKSLILSDKMLKKNPVQALAILDSLENESKLDEEEQLHLIWNRALAHQALGMSLAEDEQLPEELHISEKKQTSRLTVTFWKHPIYAGQERKKMR